jgi:uncharacterized protein YecT (DUF1311 family)
MARLITGLLLLAVSPAFALDNPDAPNHLTAFASREAPYLERANRASTTADMREAWADYEAFLDQELNVAYSGLMGRLGDRERMILRESQRKWLTYRDAEFDLIRENWSRERFGSSAVLSRGQYRTAIVRARVLQLYGYLMNY